MKLALASLLLLCGCATTFKQGRLEAQMQTVFDAKMLAERCRETRGTELDKMIDCILSGLDDLRFQYVSSFLEKR